MPFVIGLDGGATKTMAAVMDMETSQVLGRGQTGPSNWNSVGEDKAVSNIIDCLSMALTNSGKVMRDMQRVVLGVSGVDRPDDVVKMRNKLEATLMGVPSSIYNDGVPALCAGTNGVLDGVVCISGTGTIALGYRGAETRSRASGWGPLLGDKGSGLAIAMDGLSAAVQAADGRGPPTKVLEKVGKYCNSGNPLSDCISLCRYCMRSGWENLKSSSHGLTKT